MKMLINFHLSQFCLKPWWLIYRGQQGSHQSHHLQGISHALFNLTKAYFFCMASILKARTIWFIITLKSHLHRCRLVRIWIQNNIMENFFINIFGQNGDIPPFGEKFQRNILFLKLFETWFYQNWVLIWNLSSMNSSSLKIFKWNSSPIYIYIYI